MRPRPYILSPYEDHIKRQVETANPSYDEQYFLLPAPTRCSHQHLLTHRVRRLMTEYPMGVGDYVRHLSAHYSPA